jgi:hypothetical protein
MRTLLSALALSAMLCSCAVYTPAGSVVIDPVGSPGPGGGGDGGGGGGGGKFCPPGQAKKGNC